VAALVLALRNILMDAIPPPASLLLKLAGSSISVFIIGLWFFRQVKPRFYDYM
jgi:ABC-type polysaccharide/polyol phosphate export permease